MRKLSVLGLLSLFLCLCACGGKQSEKTEPAAVDDAEFYATQPIKSGEYFAVRYDIEGENPRKGQFDGRIMASLSPELSALYVYENGNRTKIDYKVILDKPFEKGDSGIYRSVDKKGLPVTISTDSLYTLTFEKGKEKISIGFESKAKNEANAFEMQQRINEKVKG